MANNERKKTYRNWCFQWNRPVVTIYCVMAEPTLFTIWCHFFFAFLLIGVFNVFFFFDVVTFPLNCSPWTCQIREYLCKTNESMIQTSIIGGNQFVVLTFRLSWHSRFWLENISVEICFFRLYLCLKNFHWICCLVCVICRWYDWSARFRRSHIDWWLSIGMFVLYLRLICICHYSHLEQHVQNGKSNEKNTHTHTHSSRSHFTILFGLDCLAADRYFIGDWAIN